MSIQPTSLSGINPLRPGPELRPDRAAIQDGARLPDAGRPAGDAVVRPDTVQTTQTQGAESAEPPQGVDPQLWSLLTGAERSYFARARELGPLTYGRQSAATSQTSIRGARLDVRV